MNSLRLLCAAFALATVSFAPAAHGDRLVLDRAGSAVTFTLDATGHTVRGTLVLKDGSVEFDAAGGPASGRVVIDATSAATGSSGRDKTMHKEVLESEKYPEFVFLPERLDGAVAREGQSQAVLVGRLEIHGVVKPVSLPASITVTGDQVAATASLTIPFVAWGMHDPSVLFLRVAKEVVVQLEIQGRWVSGEAP
jgi:polyisoprenoid-binding protein YceI